MKAPKTILLILLLYGQTAGAEDSTDMKVRVQSDSIDGSEVWVGLILENVSSPESSEHWIRETAREFSVTIPTGSESATMVFLKKNCEPVLVSLTPELLQTGLALDFSSGVSMFGSVTTTSGQPISGGSVTIDLSQILDFSLPDPDLTSWAIGADGFFEIHGLLPGPYVVTVNSPDFMPASREVVLIESDQSRELNFQVDRATYITGRIVDRYGSIVRGEFDTVVTPPESQTTPIRAEFNLEDNFRIGPFAEGITVELTAHDAIDRSSSPIEVKAPTEGVRLLIQHWVTLVGTVHNSKTGEPVEEFDIATPGEGRGHRPNAAFAPSGQLKMKIDDMTQGIEITAPGFLWWSTGRYLDLEGRDSFDLGLVELEPARSIRGRVANLITQLPIEKVTLRRLELQDGNVSHWTFNNVVATTDAEGEFEITGFPSDGGTLLVTAGGYETAHISVIDVESFKEIELNPRIVGSVSGRVVSLEGEPVYPAFVSLGLRGQRNAEDGSFSFETTGKYRITATAESGRSEVLQGTVEQGEHVTGLELVLSEIGRVHGNVLGLLKDEWSRIQVSNFLGKTVESSGPYEMRGVPIGKHLVKCITSSGREMSRSIEMDESLDVRLDFVFEHGSIVTGRVTAGGRPVSSLEVQAMPANRNHVQAKTTTKGDGTFVIEGLHEGIYQVSVTGRGVVQKLNVSGKVQIDFDLGSNELSGRIEASGPVVGVRVYLTGLGTNGRFFVQQTATDSNGFYRFTGLANGRYELTADHDSYADTTRVVEIDDSVLEVNIILRPTTSDRRDRDLKQIEEIGL